jgi:Conserved protein/domain typically associated with flavoprotein oxygenases, DIM6/NTAB family
MNSKVMFDFNYGVYVVGTRYNDRNVGCVINAAMQLSSSPMSVAISINSDNYTNAAIKESGKFTLSILTEQTKQETIGIFGFHSSENTDKFEQVEYELEENSLPILLCNTSSYITCEVTAQVQSHTHTVFIADVIAGERLCDEQPMTYSYYHSVLKGKTPPKAAVYLPDVEPVSNSDSSSGTYYCPLCGYVPPMSKEEFEALPDTWTCPLCGAPKSAFVLRNEESK